ncbi:hypothetical protein SKAU_G00233830 [Synaphobranchus kaupii]|uniref:Reverse transcriptase domain-containing protein n=1 Tax=Synaphobranchus kaupii TaxID=118154 RepID=A0A9Q1F644_SYNKA|nr:hypothetical protein SKAU_G00233830 [Synaphobranchus kaupii]
MIDLKVLGKEFTSAPAFVIPDSDYRSTVPLLVGTNVIHPTRRHLQATYGKQFLHRVRESHPEWYTALLEVGGAGQRGQLDNKVGPAIYSDCKMHIPSGKEMDLMFSIKPNTHLADVFLIENVVEFPDSGQDRSMAKGDSDTCLSLDHVVTSCNLDLSKTAVEEKHQRSLLKNLVERNAVVFSQHPLDYGHTKTVQHEIPLVDSKPFRLPYRKIPPSQWQDVRKLLMEMESTGVIRPSKSPYVSPVVIVTKKDGSLRLCIDYRKLNSCCTRDAFPLPRIEEALGQAKYFSTLDLTSGCWQVEVAKQDKPKTAFSTPMGLFEANRI